MTYSLHIIVRFELEQQLVAGTLAPEDLPEAWNAKMAELLGVDVPDDLRGVLQDVHWTRPSYGYFPTYALGNVLSVQIWRALEEDHPDLDALLESGDLAPLYETAARPALSPRPQVHAARDARARDRRDGDRPAAVPRVPAREGRGAGHCLTGFPGPVGRLQGGMDNVLDRSQALIESFHAVVRAELPHDVEIFDAHVHLGTDVDGMIGDFDELLGGQQRYGISGAFVFCLDEPDRHPGFRAANDRTLAYAARSEGRLVPFVRLDLAEGPDRGGDALPRRRRARDQAAPAGAEVPAERRAARAGLRARRRACACRS